MADEEPLQPMLPPPGHPTAAAAKSKAMTTLFNIMRDQLSISSWLLLGAVAQGLAVLALPAFYAILPAMVILSYRVTDTFLMTMGLKRNRFMDNVIMGKFTGQIPNSEGVYSSKPADENVVSFQLITRSNHPLGILRSWSSRDRHTGTEYVCPASEGKRDIWMSDKSCALNAFRKADFKVVLGSKTMMGADERSAGNHIITMMYFRNLEGVHRFAHGPIHTDTWNWWNSKGKKYGYLTIAHELYSSPKNQWENIYINGELSGLPGTKVKVKKFDQDGKEDGWDYMNAAIDARKGNLARQLGRVNQSYEKNETGVDYNY